MVKPNQFLRNVLLFIFLFFIVFDGYSRGQQDNLKKIKTFIEQRDNSPKKTQEVLTNLWTEISASPSVIPGETYTCTVKLTNQGSVIILNIKMIPLLNIHFNPPCFFSTYFAYKFEFVPFNIINSKLFTTY